MLVQAIRCKSLEGVRLALEGWILGAALLVVLAIIPSGRLGAPASVAAILVWSFLTARACPRWATRTSEWFGVEVARQGGMADPPQPVDQPSFTESAEDVRPSLVRELEADRRRWMTRPGRDTRQALALFGAWLVLWQCAGVKSSGDWYVGSPMTLALAFMAAVSLVDVWRGRIRRVGTFWRSHAGEWPTAWEVVRGRTRVPGPVWLVAFAALNAAWLVVVNAHSFGQGIGRAAALVTILAFLWQLRSGVDRVARFEETVAHKLVAQAVVALVPTAWWLTAALQWLCFGVGMTSLWAMFAVPEFAGTGVVWLMLGWFIKTSRADWGRPREPLIVNAREIKLAITGGTAIERRTSLLLGALVCATLVIAFVQEL